MTNVIIGSKNSLKRDAILDAFKVFFGQEINVQMLNVRSGVPKQPKGHQIMRGAENRLISIKKQLISVKENYDFIVSVEAGIMRIDKRFYNMQYVLVENVKTGKRSSGISQLLEIPDRYVSQIEKTSINYAFRKILHCRDDGMNFLTRGEINRKNLIKDAVLMALVGQINDQIW